LNSNKPRRVVFYTTLYINLVVAIILSAGFLLQDKVNYLLYASVSILVVFGLTYIISQNVFHKFFISDIRTIYKNVAQLNPAGNTVSELPDEQLVTEINRMLLEWEKGNKEEIVHLKELEEFRKEFLGNVSHELRTPIFTVQGYVHTLLEGGIDDAEVNILYLQKAAKSIDRLISIVDDLESISRLEAGELILELRTFDIDELIKDIIESLELKAREKNINIMLAAATPGSKYVYADKDRIRQVLINLLVNSVKYGKRGGQTVIKTSVTENVVTVNVKDNGIGIEKHHLPRLFERFYRVDKSRSREEGGTGLGLAIVKHIIEAHEQKINVESISGEETTFAFTLKRSR
jgi:two-component system, OmpR family, phosphate regulon sensor histidine kinase PhoR